MLRSALDAFRDFEDLARYKLRHRNGELRQFDRFFNLGPGLSPSLAVLFRNQRRQFIEVLLKQVAVAKEDLHAFLDRRLRPAFERVFRGRDRRVHFIYGRHRNARKMISVDRRDHVERLVGRTGDEFAVVKIPDILVLHKKALFKQEDSRSDGSQRSHQLTRILQ